LYIKDSLSVPNIDEVTRWIATAIHETIETGTKSETKILIDVFSEELFPLTKPPPDFNVLPSIETITHFINTVFKVEKLTAEPGVMCMIYINRVVDRTKITFHPCNWRRLVLSSLILASKVWEELAVWNVDFLDLFPNISVRDLNRLEKYVLRYLDFNVFIGSSEYVKAFFELRKHRRADAQNAEKEASQLEKPVDEAALKKLELRSASSEKQYQQELLNNKKPKKGSSMYELGPLRQAQTKKRKKLESQFYHRRINNCVVQQHLLNCFFFVCVELYHIR